MPVPVKPPWTAKEIAYFPRLGRRLRLGDDCLEVFADEPARTLDD
jgi:hypothetical protein